MDLAESAHYLQHHLALAGRTDPLFADDAIAALIAAASDRKALVDDDCAKRAAGELAQQ